MGTQNAIKSSGLFFQSDPLLKKNLLLHSVVRNAKQSYVYTRGKKDTPAIKEILTKLG